MDEAVRNFLDLTGARPDQAKYYICKTRGDLETAINFYYEEIATKTNFLDEKYKNKPPLAAQTQMVEARRINQETVGASQIRQISESIRSEENRPRNQNIEEERDSIAHEESLPGGARRLGSENSRNAFQMIDQGRDTSCR